MMRRYRALLRLYPEHFRQEYGEELCRAFAERTRGRSAVFAFFAAIADVVPNAIGAHWDIALHDAAAGTVVPAFSGDIRYAFRQLGRAPLFSSVIILVIALGIGISAAMLTVLNTDIGRPAPGIQPDDQLARLLPRAARDQSERVNDVSLSYAELRALRDQTQIFAGVAGYEQTLLAVDLGSGTRSADVIYATDNYFRLIRVAMAAGAGFPDDVDDTATPVVVIGHTLWMNEFAGSADAIGKTIRIMNQPFTIVGVTPPRFVGVETDEGGTSAIWVPFGTRTIVEPRADVRRLPMRFEAFARLAEGVSPSDVRALAATAATRLAQQDPGRNAQLTIGAEPLSGLPLTDGGTRDLVIGFSIVIALVVAITCANVSALLLGRAVARRREIAIRLAMGATRRRLVRQMLTESLVHASAGALLGLALYVGVFQVASATIPGGIDGLEPHAVTFFYAALFALAATFAFGLAPALHATSADIGDVMKNSDAHGIRRSRLQAGFVVLQLACSQPVLVLTSLMLAEMRRSVYDGAELAPASVVTMWIASMRPDQGGVTLPTIVHRIATVPGVTSAAVRATTPGRSFETESGASPSRGDRQLRQVHVTPGYFVTVGIPIVRGRALLDDDAADGSPAVLNEQAARRLWPDADPIGKRFVRRASGDRSQSATLTVVGIVGNPPYDEQRDIPEVFSPVPNVSAPSALRPVDYAEYVQRQFGGIAIAVRTVGDARTVVPRIRATVREIDPFLSLDDVRTLAEQYAARKQEAELVNAAAFAIAFTALVLASLGLYAIVAFAVAQRTREIGIRMAIGATTQAVTAQFVRQGVRVSAIAVAIGLPAAVAGVRVVEASLVGFSPRKMATILIVVPVLIAVAILASWLPARRAGRVDPLIALRTE